MATPAPGLAAGTKRKTFNLNPPVGLRNTSASRAPPTLLLAWRDRPRRAGSRRSRSPPPNEPRRPDRVLKLLQKLSIPKGIQMTCISVQRFGLVPVFLCVLTALIVVGCEITPTPNGGYRVVPALGEHPSIGGFYRKTSINGRCYLTNGIWCVSCDGGERVRCSDILRHTKPSVRDGNDVDFEVKPVQQHSQDLSHGGGRALDVMTLAERFYDLTGGLDGETFAIINGLIFWEPGDVVGLPLKVNRFSGDAADAMLDVAFIWRTNWKQPREDLPPGVEVLVFIDGDFEDESPETMMIKIAGPVAAVAEVLGELGTDLEVWLENGWRL
jgi:hypothetical protein